MIGARVCKRTHDRWTRMSLIKIGNRVEGRNRSASELGLRALWDIAGLGLRPELGRVQLSASLLPARGERRGCIAPEICDIHHHHHHRRHRHRHHHTRCHCFVDCYCHYYYCCYHCYCPGQMKTRMRLRFLQMVLLMLSMMRRMMKRKRMLFLWLSDHLQCPHPTLVTTGSDLTRPHHSPHPHYPPLPHYPPHPHSHYPLHPLRPPLLGPIYALWLRVDRATGGWVHWQTPTWPLHLV